MIPFSLALFQCPTRRLAGRLCHQLRRQRKRAYLQLYLGDWVVIAQNLDSDSLHLPVLLARFDATQVVVSEQTKNLLLSGAKQPPHGSQLGEPASRGEENESGSVPPQESRRAQRRRRRRARQFFFL